MRSIRDLGRPLASRCLSFALGASRDIGIGVLAAAASAAVISHIGVSALPTPFLLAPDVAATLVDGKSWIGSRPSGDTIRMTFRRDGGGSFDGPVTTPMTWSIRGQDFCIVLGAASAPKCLRFRRVKSRLTAFEDGSLAFTLAH